MNDKMVDKFEMSLDGLTKSNKARRGGNDVRRRGEQEDHQRRRRNFRSFGDSGGVQKGRGAGGITRSNSQAEVNTAWKHNIFERLGSQKVFDVRTNDRGNMGPTKLMVSNLHFGVSDLDMRDLFEDFGTLKSATVHYDRSGKSLGRADVIFEKKSDAIKAMNSYNGKRLDGKEMKIQLTTSEIPSPVKKACGSKSRLKYIDRSHGQVGRARNIGAGRPAERGRNPRNQRKALTAEELDAELDAYRAERSYIN